MHRRLSMNLHVQTIAELTPHQAAILLAALDRDTGELVCFLPPEPLRARLTYPLSTPHELDVPADGVLSVGDILWHIAKGYEDIYREPERHGVWGHGLDDLYIEGLEIADGLVVVSVGS